MWGGGIYYGRHRSLQLWREPTPIATTELVPSFFTP